MCTENATCSEKGTEKGLVYDDTHAKSPNLLLRAGPKVPRGASRVPASLTSLPAEKQSADGDEHPGKLTKGRWRDAPRQNGVLPLTAAPRPVERRECPMKRRIRKSSQKGGDATHLASGAGRPEGVLPLSAAPTQSRGDGGTDTA